jgi:hypothetical protein
MNQKDFLYAIFFGEEDKTIYGVVYNLEIQHFGGFYLSRAVY